jgi:hypothetical protein
METLSNRYMYIEADDISLINAYGFVLLGSVLSTLHNRFRMRKSIYYAGLEFGPRKWF